MLSRISDLFHAILTLHTLVPGIFAPLAVALCMTRTLARLASGIARAVRAAAPLLRHILVTAILIAIVTFALDALWGKYFQLPLPGVHDEFSYILAGDTFAHGRLTNPTHPMWKHFETIHVLQTPTYQSKFPPAQGMVLALGQLVAHRQFVGVWLSSAAAAGAVFWMLAVWLPRRWALWGTLLVVANPIVFHWGQDFWGGALPLLGGALAAGALGRLLHRPPRISIAITLGVSLFILANSRPLEGFAVAAPILLLLTIDIVRRLMRRQLAMDQVVRRLLIPVGAAVLVTFAFIGYYNWRVTGNVLRMPYAEHMRQYMVAPLFVFQSPRVPTPQFRFNEMHFQYAVWEMQFYSRLAGHPLAAAKEHFCQIAMHYFGDNALLLSLVALPWALWRDPRVRRAAALVLPLAALFCVYVFFEDHYAAPAVALAAVVLLGCLRRLKRWRRDVRYGQVLVRSIILITLCGYAVSLWTLAHSYRDDDINAQRARLVARMDELPGQQLILVRYRPSDTNSEWVFNGADIDSQKIVWAHDMGRADNAELLHYYSHSTPWLLEIGCPGTAPRLSRYFPAPATASTRQ
jgi:4-amino-4-deoxy-L-arabinose transferase-like glycosyltransferase